MKAADTQTHSGPWSILQMIKTLLNLQQEEGLSARPLHLLIVHTFPGSWPPK